MTKFGQASATPLNVSLDVKTVTDLCVVWLGVVAFAQAFDIRP